MRALLVALLTLLAAPAVAVECKDITYLGEAYTLCEVDAAKEELRLFLVNPDSGAPFGSFENVEARLGKADETLGFAMNAGMYHSDRRPVGHYVEDGTQISPVISSDGPGNFGLLPNGVFCVRDGRADVIETLRYLNEEPGCIFASQSGPMLVIDGALHPKFLKDSDSYYIRNGVGTSADGSKVWFAISQGTVNFHTFATFFRDELKAPQALYFDGNISRLYAPGLGRNDGGFPMGPIVGVVSKAE